MHRYCLKMEKIFTKIISCFVMHCWYVIRKNDDGILSLEFKYQLVNGMGMYTSWWIYLIPSWAWIVSRSFENDDSLVLTRYSAHRNRTKGEAFSWERKKNSKIFKCLTIVYFIFTNVQNTCLMLNFRILNNFFVSN